MARSFEELRSKMSPERRRRVREQTEELLRELALQELRQALNLTQEEVAQLMKIKQGTLSRLERQPDMYLSTLNRFIVALGGRLKLVASFPDREVTISQLE